MRNVRNTALGLLLLAAPAFAQFEGVVEMKMTGASMSGTGKTYVSKIGWRSEFEMKAPQMQESMKMISLGKLSNPDIFYMINDASKTYTEMNVKEAREARQGRPQEEYTIRKLGKETILGYPCEHVLLTTKEGRETELWVTKDLYPDASFLSGMNRGGRGAGGMMKALKDAGLDGWPIKMVFRGKGKDETTTVEAVRVEKRSVPAAMFEVPAGYKKQDSMYGAMPLSPDQQKQMEEMMKNLTPEQRKQMEEMMKKRRSGNQSPS